MSKQFGRAFGALTGISLMATFLSGPVLADVTIFGTASDTSTWLQPFPQGSTLNQPISADDLFTDPGLSLARYRYLRFGGLTPVTYGSHRIQVNDPSVFSVEYAGGGRSPYLFLYLPDENDETGRGDLVTVGDGIPPKITTSDGPFYEGEYLLVVSGADGAYILYVVGASLFGPSLGAQLDETLAVLSDTGRSALKQTSASVRSATQDSRAVRSGAVLGTSGQSRLKGNVYVWGQASVLSERNAPLNRTFRSDVLQFGADTEIARETIIGLAGAAGDLSLDTPDYRFAGRQFLVQPYAGWRQGPWHGNIMLTFGRIEYDKIETINGSASAKGNMMGVSADIARDFQLSDDGRTILTPSVGIEMGRVELVSTSGSLAGLGLNDTVEFVDLNLRATLTRTLRTGRVSFGLGADYSKSDAPTALYRGTYSSDGWSGSATLDFKTRIAKRTNLSTGLEIGGLGTDTRSASGYLGVEMTF